MSRKGKVTTADGRQKRPGSRKSKRSRMLRKSEKRGPAPINCIDVYNYSRIQIFIYSFFGDFLQFSLVVWLFRQYNATYSCFFEEIRTCLRFQFRSRSVSEKFFDLSIVYNNALCCCFGHFVYIPDQSELWSCLQHTAHSLTVTVPEPFGRPH